MANDLHSNVIFDVLWQHEAKLSGYSLYRRKHMGGLGRQGVTYTVPSLDNIW